MLTPAQRGGQTRTENRLIRDFGPKSAEVRAYRLEILKGLGIHAKLLVKEQPQLLDLPLAKTRPLQERKLNLREIAALAKKDTKVVTKQLDASLAPWEIFHSKLYRPSRQKQAAKLIVQRQEARAKYQGIAPPMEISRYLASIDRANELERIGIPRVTQAEQDHLSLLANEPNNDAMRHTIAAWRAAVRAQGPEGKTLEGRRRAVRMTLEAFAEGRRTTGLRSAERGGLWEAYLRYLDQVSP